VALAVAALVAVALVEDGNA